ncbi:hypothetical protein F4604DRAFT_75760 [Suillus subluteus]|nr:hypothetical protein F4604DRAFT_75760 [Suillus subluteus]
MSVVLLPMSSSLRSTTVVSFQEELGIKPSGFSRFAIFVGISGTFLAPFLAIVPFVYEKCEQLICLGRALEGGKLIRLGRALEGGLVGFILLGSSCTFNFLVAIVTTISLRTEAWCKNVDSALPDWCSAMKGGAIVCWCAFGLWLVSLILLITVRRSRNLTSPPRNTPFTRPDADIEEGEQVEQVEGGHSRQSIATHTAPTYPHQSAHDNSNASVSRFADSNGLSSAPTNTSTIYLPPTDTNRFPTADSSANSTSVHSTASTTTTTPMTSTNTSYAAWKPSMDVYGVFSDPALGGFGGVSASYAPTTSESVWGAEGE